MDNNTTELNNTMKELTKELKIFNNTFKLIFTNALMKSKLMETFNNRKQNDTKSKTNNYVDNVNVSDGFKIKIEQV